MAEVIGAVASIVQFLDIAVRLSSSLSQLCSDIRNVPRRFSQLQKDLDQQLHVAQEIRTHHLPTFVSMATLPMFDTFLLEYTALADELDKMIGELLVVSTDRLPQRTWHSLRSTRKKEEVDHLCNRLEQKKSTFSLWLNAANLKTSSDIKINTDQTQAEVEETFKLAKMIEKNSRESTIDIKQIFPQLQEIARVITGSSKEAETIKDELRQMKNRFVLCDQRTNSNALILERIDDISPQILSNTEMILQQLQQTFSRSVQSETNSGQDIPGDGGRARNIVQSSLRQDRAVPVHVGNVTDTASTSNSIADRVLTLQKRNEDHQAPLQRLEQLTSLQMTLTEASTSDFKADAQRGGYERCKCRYTNKTSYWQPFPIIHVIQTVRTQHFPSCPRYAPSDRTVDLVMKLVPPSWLLSCAIHVGLKYFRSKGAFSISPMIVGTHRLVDSNTSPAFSAIRSTREELRAFGFDRSGTYIPNLKGMLLELFRDQKASPLDVDRDGNTLLHEVLWIYERHLFIIGSDPGSEYLSLIQVLLSKGSDPNVLSLPTSWSWFKFRNIGGTAFDLFAHDLCMTEDRRNFSKVSSSVSFQIYEMLAAEGAEFSKPISNETEIFPSSLCEYFQRQAREYRFFEEQVELCDLGDLIPIILHRSEAKFRQFIAKATISNINHTSSYNRLTPTHFAVLWPEALEALIRRGADINAEDQYGRRPIHLAVALGSAASVDCLLRADCSLFTPPNFYSLTGSALRLSGSQRQSILDTLIVELSSRHKRLAERAESILKSTCFSQFEIIEGRIKEYHAPQLRNEILLSGFTVPDALELDGKSVYNVADHFAEIQMTIDEADALWSAGFEEINKPNEDGLTPILQNWFCANVSMVAWFVKKGVSLSSRHRDGSLNGLHLYAARFGYPVYKSSYDRDSIPFDERLLTQIHGEAGIPHDDCSCPCSPDGCSPVKFLCQDRQLLWPRRRIFRVWLEKVNPEQKFTQQYVLELTRRLLFDLLGCRHTCCTLGPTGSIEGPYGGIEFTRIQREEHDHIESLFEIDGLPPPRAFVSSVEEAQNAERSLEFWMSKYDEFPHREMILPEDQPFDYVEWIVEHHMTDATSDSDTDSTTSWETCSTASSSD